MTGEWPTEPDVTGAAPTLPVGAGTNKVLVIGIDGLRWDRVAVAEAPTLQGLAASGLFAPSLLDLGSGAQTLSGPGWSTIASGVWADRHGVRDNTFVGARYPECPDFLTRASHATPPRSTYWAVSWPPLATQGTFGGAVHGRVTLDGETRGYQPEDARAAGISARVLREQDPDAAFVYLGAVDMVGHLVGPRSVEYVEEIARVDTLVQKLLDAIVARPTYRDEQWLILVATDHGHRDEGGHGGDSTHERQTFVIASGAGVTPGLRTDGALVDVAPTVLHHLGIAIDESWLLAGKSLLGNNLGAAR